MNPEWVWGWFMFAAGATCGLAASFLVRHRRTFLDRLDVWAWYLAGRDTEEPPYAALKRIHGRRQ